jgi:methionine synthase II (cobalamin-independent)
MVRFRNTVVGSYPRPAKVEDTLKKPTLSQSEVDDFIRWAARDQVPLGLDIITDGEDQTLVSSVEDAFETMKLVEACYVSDQSGGIEMENLK